MDENFSWQKTFTIEWVNLLFQIRMEQDRKHFEYKHMVNFLAPSSVQW